MSNPQDNNKMVEVTVYNTTKNANFQVHHKDCRDNKKEKETANNWWNEYLMIGKMPTGEKFPTTKMLAQTLVREGTIDESWTEEHFKLHNCVDNH